MASRPPRVERQERTRAGRFLNSTTDRSSLPPSEGIVLCDPLPIRTVHHGATPGFIVEIPFDGRDQTFGKIAGWRITEFPTDFGLVDGVTPVMAFAILDMRF